MTRRSTFVAAFAIAAVLCLGGQYALGAATIPNSNNTLTACRSNTDGTLRAVSAASDCTSGSETSLTWQTRSFRINKSGLTDGQTATVFNHYGLTLSLQCSDDHSGFTGDHSAFLFASSTASSAQLRGSEIYQDPTYTQGTPTLYIMPLTNLTSSSTMLQSIWAKGTQGASAATTDAELIYSSPGTVMSLTFRITADGTTTPYTCGIIGTATPT